MRFYIFLFGLVRFPYLIGVHFLEEGLAHYGLFPVGATGGSIRPPQG